MVSVSIIVPIYNTREYLPRCLNSLLNQTLEDIEIIAVDDGSTDGSSEIVDKYALESSKIRVFHLENRGVSSARNFGLKQARGEYIGFVDSDDYVSHSMYSILFSIATGECSDISQCDFSPKVDDSSCFVGKKTFIGTKEIVDGFLNGEISNSVCSKLFSRKIISELLFSEDLIFAEDFSHFPSTQSGAMICNASQLLRMPDSYTLYPNCRAKRLYSPNGDTCFFDREGAFSTPYLDLSNHGNEVRLSYFLKSKHISTCTFSVYLVDEAGNQSLLQSIVLPKDASRIVDTVFNKPCNGFRLEFSVTGFVAFDNLKVSSSDIITTYVRNLTTAADTCVFDMLKADTRYFCRIVGHNDSLMFRTSKAIETADVNNISPYSADISVSCCQDISNARYVLKRLSDENTIYATDLFFSQVSSANTDNRALEIYNGTGKDICLEDYRVVTDIHTGSGSYSSTVVLGFTERDTIKSDSCIVIMQALHAMENNVNGVFYVNPSVIGTVVIDGNDPIALIKGNDTIDIFGNFGESISNQQGWNDEGTRTAKTVLQRRPWVTKGVKTNVQSAVGKSFYEQGRRFCRFRKA